LGSTTRARPQSPRRSSSCSTSPAPSHCSPSAQRYLAAKSWRLTDRLDRRRPAPRGDPLAPAGPQETAFPILAGGDLRDAAGPERVPRHAWSPLPVDADLLRQPRVVLQRDQSLAQLGPPRDDVLRDLCGRLQSLDERPEAAVLVLAFDQPVEDLFRQL